MAAQQYSATEVRQRYIVAMGDEFGPLFHRFLNECAWLHLKWGEYVGPFGTDRDRRDLLMKSSGAGGFFRVVDHTLCRDILLRLCRLSDDTEVGRRRRQTLSLHRLPQLVDASIEPEVRKN